MNSEGKKVKFVFLEISTIHNNANAMENETKFWKFKKLYLKNYERYTKSLNAFTLWIVPSLFTCKFGDRKCVIIGDTITRKRVWALISPSINPPFTKFQLQDTWKLLYYYAWNFQDRNAIIFGYPEICQKNSKINISAIKSDIHKIRTTFSFVWWGLSG